MSIRCNTLPPLQVTYKNPGKSRRGQHSSQHFRVTMTNLVILALLLIGTVFSMIGLVEGHSSHHGSAMPPIPQPHLTPGQNPMHDKAFVENKAHMQEHLDGITNKRPEDMNEQELQFHYFKLHDTDTNNKLDGLELIHAITHYHGGEVPSVEGTRVLTDHELSMTVDAIFLDDDRNNDGYIDYSEFASSQTRNQNNNQGPPPPRQ